MQKEVLSVFLRSSGKESVWLMESMRLWRLFRDIPAYVVNKFYTELSNSLAIGAYGKYVFTRVSEETVARWDQESVPETTR